MNLSELLDIIQVKTTINAYWESADYLSTLLLELASYYSTLGKFVADSELERNQAELEAKVNLARKKSEYTSEKDPDTQKAVRTVAESEALAEVDVKQDKQLYLALEHKARLLFLTRQNLDKTMDAIRSRLSYIKMDKEGSRAAV